MKTRLTLTILLFTVAGLAEHANAQTGSGQPYPPMRDTTTVQVVIDAPGARAIAIDEAIRMAMDKNYDVNTATLEVTNAESEHSRAEDNLLPDLTASAGYNYNYAFNPGNFFGIPNPATSQSIRYNLGSTFNIYSGGGDAASIRSTQYDLESSKGTLSWTRQLTAFNVVADYILALRNRELVFSAEKTLAESKVDLARTQGLYSAGSVPVAQVYQQESVVGQNELGLIQAENNYENSKADLLFQLNVAPSDYANYSLNLTGIDTTTSVDRRKSVEGLMLPAEIDRVIESRPDIAAARSRVLSSQASVDALRSSLYPRLDANAGIGGSGSNQDVLKVQPENAFSAGLSLSVPLFDKFQNRLRIDEEKVLVEENQIHLTQLEQQLRSDVAKAVNNVRFAEQGLDASDRALRAAEESMRLAEERLRVGAGIQLDVIVAESQLTTARTNRVNAVFNFVLSQRQLEYTLGHWSY